MRVARSGDIGQRSRLQKRDRPLFCLHKLGPIVIELAGLRPKIPRDARDDIGGKWLGGITGTRDNRKREEPHLGQPARANALPLPSSPACGGGATLAKIGTENLSGLPRLRGRGGSLLDCCVGMFPVRLGLCRVCWRLAMPVTTAVGEGRAMGNQRGRQRFRDDLGCSLRGAADCDHLRP